MLWTSGIPRRGILLFGCEQDDSVVPIDGDLAINESTSNLGGNQDKVCDLMNEAYSLFGSTPFIEFFDDDLWDLLAQTTPLAYSDSVAIDNFVKEGLELMFTESVSFKAAYNEVELLGLSSGAFSSYKENCSGPRACWICNATACARATALVVMYESNPVMFSWAIVGYVGVEVHCP